MIKGDKRVNQSVNIDKNKVVSNDKTDSRCDSNGSIGQPESVLPPVRETGGIQKIVSTVPDTSEMHAGIKGDILSKLTDSNAKVDYKRIDESKKCESNVDVDAEHVVIEARNDIKVSPGLNVSPGPSKLVKDIDLVRHLPSKKQDTICSTNEKRGRPLRSFNKVTSPKYKNLSPKLSPKAKIALKLSQKKGKMKSRDKIEDKMTTQERPKKNQVLSYHLCQF